MVRRRRAVSALLAAGLMLLALLCVFAIELSNTQAKSKKDVEARVHERAVLAAALIDSLFQSVEQNVPQYARIYGKPTVSARTMNANVRGDAYLALLGPDGQVLAASRGFTAQARSQLSSSGALALVRRGHPYGLGNLLPYGRSETTQFAVPLPTPAGQRVLVTGFAPNVLGAFIANDLRKIPGVTGAHNFLIDENRVVLASTKPSVRLGDRLNSPAQVTALSHANGDVKGHYYDQVPLSNATWRILLSAPNGPLFASVTGLRKWIPWLIFIAFALVALLALLLAGRAVRAADQVREANRRLELLNGELAATNEALGHRAAELARSNEELEQFASIASHDLQEPLRKIRTFAQRVAEIESDRLSDRGRDYLGRTSAAAERMQTLIEGLLKYSRVATHAKPFAPVDLQVVMDEVLDDLEAQIQETGASIRVGGLPTIGGDPLQMRQLFQNLLSNALKFRREGVPPEVAIDARETSGHVEITFGDNGIGFDAKYQSRIFRVFERLHGRSDYPGSGIGLALCRKIVERHGGTMWAEGSPGEGSTFTLKLPLHQRQEVPLPASDGSGVPEDAAQETYVPA